MTWGERVGKLQKDRSRVEFGDFQTPMGLAAEVCALLSAKRLAPRSVVEPTCGIGNLLFAAVDAFPKADVALGIDVSDDYVRAVRSRLRERADASRFQVERASFFSVDWERRIARLPEPIFIVGNPPWVTSSDLGYLKSHNIPEKENFHGRAGIDAVTGKSNFDISEWMLIKLLSWIDGRHGLVAMLCKTAVARKVLLFGWAEGFRISSASIHRIDAAKHFDASVDACLLIVEMGVETSDQMCPVFDALNAKTPGAALGYREGVLVANAMMYDKWKSLMGNSQYQWRSGVKHDCAAVMELRRVGSGFENGDGETIALEEKFLYPMLKSSDIARDEVPVPKRWMIVTQEHVGQDTLHIKEAAKTTWAYLTRHRARFEKRASSIYKGKPPFSIFGVGDYTFAPWKVAISGLYKKLEFRVIRPHEGKPVVLDDTCYFVACASEAEACFLARLLASEVAREFFSAFIFWDAKRPITADLLRRLDLRRLAQELGQKGEFDGFRASKPEHDEEDAYSKPGAAQLELTL